MAARMRPWLKAAWMPRRHVAVRQLAARRVLSGVSGGCECVGPQRRRVLARQWLLLSPRQALGRTADRGWLGLLWLAGLELTTNSWTAPVDSRCLPPGQNPSAVAALQIRGLLQCRPELAMRTPLFVFDGDYDSVRLALELAGAPAQIFVRVRSDRFFYADRRPALRRPRGGLAATVRSSAAPTRPPGRPRTSRMNARTNSTAR